MTRRGERAGSSGADQLHKALLKQHRAALAFVYTYCILEMRFEWDPDKAERNLFFHGIAFEDA